MIEPAVVEKAITDMANENLKSHASPPMPIAYISGAYRSKKWGWFGILINILRARRVAIKFWQMGYGVITPHLNTAFFDGKAPDSVWIEGDCAIIKRLHRRTDIVVMLKNWEKSSGARMEHALAKKRRLRIMYE